MNSCFCFCKASRGSGRSCNKFQTKPRFAKIWQIFQMGWDNNQCPNDSSWAETLGIDFHFREIMCDFWKKWQTFLIKIIFTPHGWSRGRSVKWLSNCAAAPPPSVFWKIVIWLLEKHCFWHVSRSLAEDVPRFHTSTSSSRVTQFSDLCNNS